MFKKFRIVVFIISQFCCLSHLPNLYAQDFFKGNNLSQVKVESLPEADILKLKNELRKSNTSLEQAEVLALSKGMSPSEFGKLKQRLLQTPGSNTNTEISGEGKLPSQSTETNITEEAKEPASQIFGSELFRNHSLTFEPNLKIATPMNYILGAGDEIQISLYGTQEYNATIPVSVEGKVTLQNVGQINVGGMTLEAATQSIKQAMGKVYSSLQTGESNIGVTLSKIRTIKVTVIGSIQPGNYSISSLATVFNALHLSGGPAENGSYRNIELIRNNKLERKIDIYRFLINGDQTDNIGLKDNDVIRIPTYSKRVEINGEVKRPGIFELLPNEKLSDLLQYASGFTDWAYHNSVKLIQKTGSELKILEIKEENFMQFIPHAGDVFTVSKILSRFENRITLSGAVFRPDIYAFTPGLTMGDLILKAGGLKEDAYTERASIYRLKTDLTKEMIDINLKAIFKDKKNDIELKREDEIMIYSILELKNDFIVTIDGEVKKPGKYPFLSQLSLNDLILLAGGLSDAASRRVEIARMVKSDDIGKNNTLELVNIEIDPANNEQTKNIVLKPFDMVSIRRMPVYFTPDLVTVSGAVKFTGKYALISKKETVLEIVNRAGGLTSEAAINGVKIKRRQDLEKIESVDNINTDLTGKDSTAKALKKINERNITIPIEFNKIKNNFKSRYNIILFPGDEIVVSRFEKSVKVTGNVLLSSQIPYVNRGVRYFLSSVGGINSRGWKKRIYVVYPNGRAATTKSFLFCRWYPRVDPGSQIVVPTEPERRKMSTSEVVSLASVLTSMASIIFLVLRK